MSRPSSDLLCLRCGYEGHTSDECSRPIPAWPAESPAAEAKPACTWPKCTCLPADRCPSVSVADGRAGCVHVEVIPSERGCDFTVAGGQ